MMKKERTKNSLNPNFFLERLPNSRNLLEKNEHDENETEKEANSYETSLKNAGGYSNGVLINMK